MGFLHDQHQKLIDDSAISESIAKGRGYQSVEVRSHLVARGFGQRQGTMPGMLIPLYNPQGEIAGYQYRPDTPRVIDGRAIKYETPKGSGVMIDIHPCIRDRIGDPTVPLFVTEGIRKADSANSMGLCCIGLLGVDCWRGTNEHGGITALATWNEIAFKGSPLRSPQPDPANHYRDPAPMEPVAPAEVFARIVYIVFDSDARIKRGVWRAMERLGRFLTSRGAEVYYILLPCRPGGAKAGMDDFFAVGGSVDDLLAFATDTLPAPPVGDEEESECPYRETPHGIIRRKPVGDGGAVDQPLTNFTAQIVAEVIEDDGAEQRHLYEIEAERNGQHSRRTIPASSFTSMNWIPEILSAGALLYPGQTIRDHARAAIQMLSGDPPVSRLFTHIGWRKIGDGYAYLHGGGAIGTDDDVSVSLSGALAHFALPAPPEGDELIRAIRASMGLLDLAPAPISTPIFVGPYRAALGHVDFGLHVAGATGVFKTELTALSQQHFGPGMDARNLPASWSSTDNALEGLAFAAKDAILTIDDFCPTGTTSDVQRLHSKADRVLRAQGNASARSRMRHDGSLRPPRPPRGLIVSTGEDIPQGQSLKARLGIVEVGAGDIDPKLLTVCQHDAADGLYAQVMAGYLAWLAPHYEEIAAGLRDEIRVLREKAASSSQHRRTPGIVASLSVGLRYFLRFALHAGAITTEEAKGRWHQGRQALDEMARAQARHQSASDPTVRFFELLSAAVSSGKAHVASMDNADPAKPARWGWRQRVHEFGTEWLFQGVRIGWVDGDDLYLEPEAAHDIARRMGAESGDPITIAAKTLHKRLAERGLLMSRDAGRHRLLVRHVINGDRKNVLHVCAHHVVDSEPTNFEEPSQPSHSGLQEGTEAAESTDDE